MSAPVPEPHAAIIILPADASPELKLAVSQEFYSASTPIAWDDIPME